ncbi:hypothetical protein VTK73DRAFT_4135 [Phialemonium thermophilum]|uniref:Zn(2)-C6 fungal-type domain-containing protein n=1 Tax=Phialemonium thermophilum TaxID=223376 RepID=A0ABR3WVR0_9PEZI
MHKSSSRRLQMHSCDICRRRKIRCDSIDERSCSACLRAGVECRFTVGWRRQRRRRPPAAESSSPDRHDSDAALHTPDERTAVASLVDSRSKHGSSPSAQTTGSQPCSCSQPSRGSPSRGGGGVPPESEVAMSINIAENGLLRFFRDGLPSNSWDIFDDPDKLRVAYVGTHISNMTHLIRLDRPRPQYLVYPYPQIKPPICLSSDSQQGNPHDAVHDIHSFPERPIRDDFVEAYFDKVHPYFPVVDEADFRARYADPHNQPPLLLLHSVLLVGAHVSSHEKARQARHMVKAVLFRRAKCVFDMRHENDRLHLVQAALLFTWHLQNGDTASCNSSYWLGVACRIAFGIGLHRDLNNRDPSAPERMPMQDRRAWRRTWWTLFQAEVMSALEHGRPSAIRAEDFDQEPLCVDDFREVSGEVNPRVNFEYCIKNAELCQIALDVINLSAPRAASTLQNSLELLTGALNAKLVAWMLGLPASLHTFGDVYLRLHYHTIVIHLFRLTADRGSLPESATSSSSSEEARRIGSSASGDIVAGLELLHARDMLAQCPFTAVTALTAAAIQIAHDIQSSLGSAQGLLAVNGLGLLERVCVAAEHLSAFWPNAAGVRKVFRSLLDQFTGAIHGMQQGEEGGGGAPCLVRDDFVGVDWTEILGLTWHTGSSPPHHVHHGWDASILGLN